MLWTSVNLNHDISRSQWGHILKTCCTSRNLPYLSLFQSSPACISGRCKASSRSWWKHFFSLSLVVCNQTSPFDISTIKDSSFTHLQVSQTRWPFLHWKIRVGGIISSKQTWDRGSNLFHMVVKCTKCQKISYRTRQKRPGWPGQGL